VAFPRTQTERIGCLFRLVMKAVVERDESEPAPLSLVSNG